MNKKQPEPAVEARCAPATGSAITPEIGEACARLLMSDSRLHAVVDSYANGRLILSALYGRMGYKYPDGRQAQHDLIVALGHKSWAGKSPNDQAKTRPDL